VQSLVDQLDANRKHFEEEAAREHAKEHATEEATEDAKREKQDAKAGRLEQTPTTPSALKLTPSETFRGAA
jgi:hypothetical protein